MSDAPDGYETYTTTTHINKSLCPESDGEKAIAERRFQALRHTLSGLVDWEIEWSRGIGSVPTLKIELRVVIDERADEEIVKAAISRAIGGIHDEHRQFEGGDGP